MLIEKVKETVEKHNLIGNRQHIVLGLSGGPDSMCLFDVLMRLSEEKKLKIYPVHINHGLRPVEADRDQEYVENVCGQRGVICRSFSVDCHSMAEELKMTDEEAGRKARYDAFFETAKDISTAYAKIPAALSRRLWLRSRSQWHIMRTIRQRRCSFGYSGGQA